MAVAALNRCIVTAPHRDDKTHRTSERVDKTEMMRSVVRLVYPVVV